MLENLEERNNTKTPKRKWVWHSSEESILLGQISILAIIETIIVLFLYILVVHYFGFSLLLILYLATTPMLLLSSPKSQELSLKLFKLYWSKNTNSTSFQKKYLPNFTYIYFISCFILFVLLFIQLETSSNKELFFISGLFISIISNIISIALSKRSIHTFRDTDLLLNSKIILYSFLIPIVLYSILFIINLKIEQPLDNQLETLKRAADIVVASTFGLIFGTFSSFISILFSSINFSNDKNEYVEIKTNRPLFLVSIFFSPIHSAGFLLRIVIIKIHSVVNYIFIGLRNLPENLRKHILFKDCTYTPEILPNIEKADENLTFKSLKNKFKKTSGLLKFYNLVNITLWYFSAQLWSWSLKATIWLWFPVALLLKQPFEGKELEQVRDIAAVRVIVSKWLGALALLFFLLLASSYSTEVQSWTEVFGDNIEKPFTKLAELQIPPPGLRQWLMWLSCFLLAIQWVLLIFLQARHKKLLEEEDSIYSGVPKARLQIFLSRAKTVQWFHTVLIVSFILLGYSYILYFISEWRPDMVKNVIPPWLVDHL